MHRHMMQIARTGSLTVDLFGLPLSGATVLAAIEEAKDRLQPTVDALGIPAEFFGTLIHDNWKPYRELLCKHGLCNILFKIVINLGYKI